MPRALIGGVGIAYYEWPGHGPALLCVHGITANCHAWDLWAERLTPAFRVIAPDLRGRGDSGKPPEYPAEIHRDPHCHPRDLDAICDALGLEEVHYIGHSLGAMVGVIFAAVYPHRVCRLVLVDGGHNPRRNVVAAIRPALDRLDVSFPSLEAYLAHLQTLPLFAGQWNEHLARHYRYDAEVLRDGSVRSRVSRAAVEADAEALLPLDLTPYQRVIRAHTLVLQAPGGLVSDSDAIMTREEGEQVAAAIPNARLVTVSGTNHYSILFGSDPRGSLEARRFLSG